ncbi:efflux RND transporter periplasmic adaptor subunit [Marinimicrobium sp. ABcell2]|uniref:efflux RND transporter periplasmic adaptor subunit n=1 Tax=Marinimicrobium sp. ABcell2 TaxID=3069751 RepID=UPI0027B824EA|nr:efflux RND transporter periplasmic adaptor subunit [Marinimicrobium sp. ABcell2]MDQ2076111.1 efflux RND transporter periplasmic adaptor subunit [Marinimicrobium sp. ABcell2]
MISNRILALVGLVIFTSPLWVLADSGPEVIVQQVFQEKLSSRVEALGSLRANESIRLSSQVTRTVTRINFQDGQRVSKGRVLVEMTSSEELALLDEARINAEEARKQKERVEALVRQGAVSQSNLDERVRQYESAQARFNAIQARLDDLRIRAPFDGVVGLRNISVGALVSPGELITTLNDDSQMKLDFTVPSIHLRHLRVGLPIEARSRAMGDQVFMGEVYSIDNRVDPVTRSITVRALLPNDGQQLMQGLLMNVTLSTRERDAAMISESALITTGSNHHVFVVQGDEGNRRAERVDVTIGQRTVGRVEILSGLEPGQRVVTHGVQKVRDGEPVRIRAEETGSEALSDLLKR